MGQGTAATGRIGHSDRPLESVAQDSLGLRDYAQSLADFIRHCDTPFTVAVQGDWGTGKTSLMRMVERLLKPPIAPVGGKHIDIVRFETWQYSQFGSMAALPVSLLATLRQCLSGDPGKLEQTKQVMGRLIRPVADYAYRRATGGMSELADLEGLFAQQAIDSASNANQLKKEIAEVIRRKIEGGTDRIVVFIDDLDRIKPAIAVEILETIKLFVDVEGCVFVLALDYGVVSRGLGDKFGVSEEDLGRSFFDKIIQLPFSVPVARFTIPAFIGTLFRDMTLPMQEDDKELFAEAVRWSVWTNPRGIKRVFNSLQLLIGMANARNDRQVIRILFAVLCLQTGFPGVYAWLLDRGDRITGADLFALGNADDEGRDPDLRAALARVGDERRGDLARFAAVFLEAVQDPDRPGDDIDETELAAIRRTLTFSRVTSVPSAQPAPAAPNDPEFRWRNRELMGRVRAALEERLAADIAETGRGFWSNTAHQASNVWLNRNVTRDGSLNLVLDHGEREVLMYVTGGKRAIRGHAALLAQLLGPIASPFEDHGDDGVRFFRRSLPPGAGMDDREALLTGEAMDLYLHAQRVLKERLWR